MKLGCICGSFNRSFAAGAMDQLRFVAHCADVLGVAGVEFQDIHFPETRPAYLDRLRRAAVDRGLAIIGIGIHNDFGRRDECLRASEVVKVKQWVEVAERLGAPMVRVFAGWPEGTAAERWDDMIANLREAAAFAQAAGVRLGLENEAGFTPSVAEHVRILEEVGSPALGLLLDTGNYSGRVADPSSRPRRARSTSTRSSGRWGRAGRSRRWTTRRCSRSCAARATAAGSPSSTRRPSRRRRDFRAPSPTCAG